ncbi:Acetyltransferase (GNAT) family protein [compost metagenome]
MTEYNFLHNDHVDYLQGEMRPALEHYFLKLYDYEHALRGPRDNDLPRGEVLARVKRLVEKVDYAIFAVPKNEDGQTRGILVGDNEDPNTISVLWVNEAFRSQQLGQQLVEEFQKVRPGGILNVEVAKFNPRAQEFYERLGFQFNEFDIFSPGVVKGHRIP